MYNLYIFLIIEEILFGIIFNFNEKGIINKFNYIMLFMCYFIYSCKLNNKFIDFFDFVNVV